MATNEVILLRGQAGIEGTRGTAVAATRKVYAQLTGSYERALSAFADTTGTYDARRRPVYARQKPRFTAVDLVTFEDIAWWMQFFLKGGVVGVGDGDLVTEAFTYTFVPSASTDDLESMTLEFNEDGNPYESDQVMCRTWNLRGDSDNDNEPGWMLDMEMIARTWVTTAFTTSLADRDTEVVTARGTKLFIDASGGAIGTTQKTGDLISWSFAGNINRHFKAFAEDESAYAANKVGRGERTVDGQLTFEFDDDVEFANYRSNTPVQRLIRLEREGTTIHDAVKKRLRVDLAGYWSSWTRSDREGNLTATMNLMGFYDDGIVGSLNASVITDLATLP